MYTFIGILLYSTKFYFINILRISSLRVSRKSLPRCERHFTKISIRLVFIIFSSPFLSFAEFRREKKREKEKKNHGLYQQLLSPQVSLRILCRFEFRRTVKGIKNRLLNSLFNSISFSTPFVRTAILPFIFKIIFRDERSRISNLAPYPHAPGGRVENKRMGQAYGDLARSRDTASFRSLKPLVVRPVLRFRSTIKLISAFYSIGMYKGGWTDYFLVPALDCRESRTHFFLRTRARAYTHTPVCIGVYCVAPRCIFLELKRREHGTHRRPSMHARRPTLRDKKQPEGWGEKKRTEQFIAHDSGLLPVRPSV